MHCIGPRKSVRNRKRVRDRTHRKGEKKYKKKKEEYHDLRRMINCSAFKTTIVLCISSQVPKKYSIKNLTKSYLLNPDSAPFVSLLALLLLLSSTVPWLSAAVVVSWLPPL